MNRAPVERLGPVEFPQIAVWSQLYGLMMGARGPLPVESRRAPTAPPPSPSRFEFHGNRPTPFLRARSSSRHARLYPWETLCTPNEKKFPSLPGAEVCSTLHPRLKSRLPILMRSSAHGY